MKWPKIAVIGVACCIRSEARSVVIEHAFSPGGDFSYRGALDLVGFEGSPSATVPPVNLGPNAPQLEDLITNDELYLIRVATDDSSGRHVVAAVPACHLRLASFREDITLHVDWDGIIVGLDYKAPVGPLASTRDCTKMPVSESSKIVTSVKVVRPASAHSVPLQVVADTPPPGLTNLKETIGTQDPKTSGNQSILAKYWYIFVPMLVFWIMSPATPEQPGATGGSTSAAGAQASGGARGGQ